MLNASRMPPSAARATSETASFSASLPFASSTCFSRFSMSAAGMRRKSKRWQRERMVAGRRWGSVVARMNTAWAGGSSSVLSSALNAPVESM